MCLFCMCVCVCVPECMYNSLVLFLVLSEVMCVRDMCTSAFLQQHLQIPICVCVCVHVCVCVSRCSSHVASAVE